MKSKYIVYSVALIFALLMVLSSVGSNAATAPFYTSSIKYPSDVGAGQSFNVTIVSTANFANYNFTVYFAGTNLTGISPTSTIHHYSANNPMYTFSMVAPSVPQTLYLYVVTSAKFDGIQYNYTQTISIDVVSPVYFHVELKNPTSYPIYNITATFYVDGIPVAAKTVPKIMPGSTVEVNVTYVNPNFAHGSHTLIVKINNPNIKIDGNSNYITTSFYYGSPPNYDWIFYVFAVVLGVMIIMVMGSGRRASQPKWKRTKK
ncbi:TVG1270428 [Thermoplasma volcanium GSS1]|uniref:TVG1270428 protein n=1 Tax=Thermoplasma volcanium (strain ATCC 51530 / DSM 4299 / JCM 9571 / NBRC 15438 / GSS1) TaxID=273116 RepID=Q979C7_THEVO|nr:CARDB domain-containing protein [Thermoplasma volcanium]BAB60376.1 TVG1270428 [Thermoplasma volcanium GSS1]